jgi:malate dehydrogenase (oxaloacetate-decarboxylating)
VATGRSDFANQVNNVLAFPGIFRGALDAHATRITPKMYVAAAKALAGLISSPEVEKILPHVLDPAYDVAQTVAQAVARIVYEEREKQSEVEAKWTAEHNTTSCTA